MRFLILLASFLLTCGAACAAEAVPATAFFPVLPLDAPEGATPQMVPIAANQPLDRVHAGTTQAIIIIHDETRDANNAVALLSALAGGMNDQTVILAPQFLLPSDIVRFADHLPDKGKVFAAWQVSGWAMGDDSMPVPGHKSLSSFTVVDLLLMHLADRNAFPDLQSIVIAGFGAGGNFVQRYAAFGLAAEPMARLNLAPRYLVAGASSYLYQTASRPLGGRKGFGFPDKVACPDYNAYPYGLEKLKPYTRRAGINAAKIDYATRFITYLSGATPDTAPETNCAALTQGPNSGARMQNYKQYMQSLYSDVAARTQVFVAPKDTKSDAVGLLGSACGMAVLFGDGLCPPSSGALP